MIYNTEFIKKIAVFACGTAANLQIEFFVVIRLAVFIVRYGDRNTAFRVRQNRFSGRIVYVDVKTEVAHVGAVVAVSELLEGYQSDFVFCLERVEIYAGRGKIVDDVRVFEFFVRGDDVPGLRRKGGDRERKEKNEGNDQY